MDPIVVQIQSRFWPQMMGYIVRSASGNLVVIDGGWEKDAAYLVELIHRFGGEGCEITWLLTHQHIDHIGALTAICQQRIPLPIRQIRFSFLPAEAAYAAEPNEGAATVHFLDALRISPYPVVPLVRGERFLVDELAFEVLCTPDPRQSYPSINDMTSAFRMTAYDQTWLFLGDLGPTSGEALRLRMGESLHADLCQLAHHGQQGVDFAFYQAVQPKVALWATPDWLWENDNGSGRGSGPWKTLETRAWMDRLGVKEHVIAKDGTAVLPMPFRGVETVVTVQ